MVEADRSLGAAASLFTRSFLTYWNLTTSKFNGWPCQTQIQPYKKCTRRESRANILSDLFLDMANHKKYICREVDALQDILAFP